MSEILTKQENFAIISLQFNPSNIRKKEPATRTARTDPFTDKDSAVGNEKCLPPIFYPLTTEKENILTL